VGVGKTCGGDEWRKKRKNVEEKRSKKKG